jgi:hypothetical protein
MSETSKVKICIKCNIREKAKNSKSYCRLCHNARMREWHKHRKSVPKRDSEKDTCRNKSKMIALRLKVPKQPCSLCGHDGLERRIERHHVDYSKPWIWIWLCSLCHRRCQYGKLSLDGAVIFDVYEHTGKIPRKLDLRKQYFEYLRQKNSSNQ